MLGEQTLTVQRAGTPVLTAGEWVASGPTLLSIRGTLLPISERNREHILRLPEGWRNAARWVLITRVRLQPLSVQTRKVADRVLYDGKGLLLAAEADFSTLAPRMSLKHYRYVLLDEEATPL